MNYYSLDRFNNWIEKIRESHIDFSDPESLVVFDRMMEDLVVACLNIIRAVKERELTKKNAVKELKKIEKIVTSNVDFKDRTKNDFFEYIREGLRAIVNSAIYCLEGRFSKKSFNNLIKEAVKKEKKGDLDGAFDHIVRIGAKVFKGEKLPEELLIPEDSVVLSWIDGVDAINTVMLLMEIDSSEVE